MKKYKKGNQEKEGLQEVPPETAQKNKIKEMLEEIVQQLRPKKTDFEQPSKEKEKQKKGEKNLNPEDPSGVLFVFQFLMQPVCLCRLTLLIMTCGVDADVLDI